MDTLKTYGPTTVAALVAGMVGAVIVGGSRAPVPIVQQHEGSASVRGGKSSPCAAAVGTFDSVAAVPTVDGCRLIFAERPMSLMECLGDRTHVIVREHGDTSLLVIRCELAGDPP